MNSPQDNAICIRPMQQSHIPALAALERLCFSSPWSERGLAEELSNPNAVFLVAERGGDVLGYIGMHHVLDEGAITNIAVFPTLRRQGVGNCLLDACMRYGDTHGLSQIVLEVRPSNLSAIALYRRFGFESVGIRRGFYILPPEDALIMRREKHFRPKDVN